MEEKRLDRRVRHTRQRLRSALLDLMKDKRISDISPTELCRKADINRNTFYAHYAYPGELLASIEEDLIAEVRESVQHSLALESARELILEICEWIRRNKNVYEAILSGRGDASFVERLLFLGREKSIKEWQKAAPHLDERRLDSMYSFTANGAVAVITAWIQDPRGETASHVADFIERISMQGIRTFLDQR